VKEANPNTKERTKMNKEQSKQLLGEQQANTVLQGDCVNVMRQLRSGGVDFVLTDPPYLAHYRSRDGRTVANDDNATWLKPAFADLPCAVPRFLLRQLLWLAPGGQIHSRVARGGLPARRTLDLHEAIPLNRAVFAVPP
jgi:DNA modification methylase